MRKNGCGRSGLRTLIWWSLGLALALPGSLSAQEASPAALQTGSQTEGQASSTRLLAYVGTFSSPLKDMLPTQVDLPPGNGGGIHIFEVDRSTGRLSAIGVCELGNSPSCLTVDATGTRLYSANETERQGPDKHGTVSAFSIAPEDGKLSLLNSVSSAGAGPTYVSLHPSGRQLFVANYFGGSVAVLPLLNDGQLGPASDVQVSQGEIGPTRATNAPPGSFAFSGHDRTHAHMISSDPSGNFVLHVDLGLDKIFMWRFDSQLGRLTPGDPPSVSLPAGDGPRHFDFHPNGQWLYSIQEEGSTVALFDYSSTAGRLTWRQTLSTLPAGFVGSNFCSGIVVSPDGKFLYAGNRLHDSIALFSVGSDGRLSYVEEQWTQGNYPRSFAFDPSGNFLYCCNQRSDNIAVFRVDRATGRLQFTGHFAAVGNPSMVTFVELPPL